MYITLSIYIHDMIYINAVVHIYILKNSDFWNNRRLIVDDLCEVAKWEMKEKNDGDLGSWK